MNIDLINADFVNKGSFLMMIAIVQKLTKPNFEYQIAVDMRVQNRIQRSELNLNWIPRRDFYSLPIQIDPLLGMLASFLPVSYRKSHNIILEKEIDAVFDAAGFLYSDQGPSSIISMMSKRYLSWKKQGKKLIMLPQAFGPFRDINVSANAKKIIESADLIFARDKVSYKHLLSLAGESSEKIYCAPDFTNLVEGEIPDNFDIGNRQPCIIPNYRMMDKTHEQVRDRYIPVLAFCIKYLLDKGFKPFFLIHESSRDEEIINILQEMIPRKLTVIHEPNPIYIKGILANSSFVIGSRFHGLVSALSQGTPVIATSWSHKYEELLSDYRCPKNILTFNEDENEIRTMIDSIIDPAQRQTMMKDLLVASEEQKKLTYDMWELIMTVLKVQQ